MARCPTPPRYSRLRRNNKLRQRISPCSNNRPPITHTAAPFLLAPSALHLHIPTAFPSLHLASTMQHPMPNLLQRSTDEPQYELVIIVPAILLGLVLTIVIFFLIRTLCYRRHLRNLNPTLQPTNSSLPSHQATYSSPQSPAFVRLQRLAQTSGLTVSELSHVAPVTPFEKQQGEENTCPVCLDDMHQESKTRRLPCRHAFDAQYVFLSPLTNLKW